VNVLLVSSRFPWPPFTGDRLRATIWLAALANVANVALVAPNGAVPANAPRLRFYPVAPSIVRGVAGALRVIGGAPVQSLLAAPYDWEGAIARAQGDAGGFDAAIVLLSRLDPWVRAALPAGFHVLDAIDLLRRSMNERASEASPLTRWFWRAESRRIGRVEEDAARAYDRIVVVSEEEAGEVGAVVISNGAAIAPLEEAPRPIDFGFWGRLAYFANADAVSWLLDEIWPAVRARRPDATLLLAGAEAPARVRAMNGRDGITVQSPVDDIAAMARRIKVAIFPVRYGTGQSSKVLEAAEGGCAIVATTRAMRGFVPLLEHSFLADDAAGLARSAVEVISDEARRTAKARALRQVVEQSYARQDTLERLAAVIRKSEAAA
jgi:glycosyltransferase involved in cell wall biosynthesis